MTTAERLADLFEEVRCYSIDMAHVRWGEWYILDTPYSEHIEITHRCGSVRKFSTLADAEAFLQDELRLVRRRVVVSDHSGHRVEYPAAQYSLEQAAREYVRSGDWHGATAVTVLAWHTNRDVPPDEFTIPVAAP